jgi:hypothetical protein
MRTDHRNAFRGARCRMRNVLRAFDIVLPTRLRTPQRIPKLSYGMPKLTGQSLALGHDFEAMPVSRICDRAAGEVRNAAV